MNEHPNKKHVDKRLRIQIRIFAVIFLSMLMYTIYEVVLNVISIKTAAFGMVLGTIVGIIAGRISNVFWHEEKNKVVSQIDITGGVILVGYILFSIYRNKFFGHWLTGAQLSAFSFTFLSGTMLGRVLSTGISIRNVLSVRGLLKK